VEKLKDLYVWDAITAEEYRSRREELERQLLLLPDRDKLVTFDQHRQVLVSISANIEIATPSRRQELLGMLIERVVASGRAIQEIVWAPAARPFFGADRTVLVDGVVVLARPEGLEPPTL
jgi:hypothetical protein